MGQAHCSAEDWAECSWLLACGYEGVGRLWQVEGIVEKAEEILGA